MTHWIHAPAYVLAARELFRELRRARWKHRLEEELRAHTCHPRPLFESLDPNCPGCRQARANFLASMERE